MDFKSLWASINFTGLLDLRRAAFRQQRSYSHNDISPCTEHEKWEKEGVIDNLIANTRNTTPVKGAVATAGKAPTEPTEPSPTVGNTASSSLPAAAATASPSSPPSQLQEQQQSPSASSSSLLAIASQTITTTTTTTTTTTKSSSSSPTIVSHNAKRARLPSPPQLESASLAPSSSQQEHPVEHRVHSPLPNNTSETLREDSFDPCTWSPIEDSDHGAIDDGQKKRAAASSSKSRIPSRIPTKQATRQDSGSSSGSQKAKTPCKVEARTSGNSLSDSCDKTVMASRDSRTNTGSSSRAPKSPRDSGQHYSGGGQRRASGRASMDHGVHEPSSRRMSGQTSTGQRPVARRSSKESMVTGSPRTEHRGSRDAGVPAVSSNRSTRRLSREAATDSTGYSKSDRRQSREYYQQEIEPHGSRHSRDSVTSTASRRYSGSVEGQRSQGQGYRSETQGRSSQRPDNQVPHGYRTHENIGSHEDVYHKARSDGRSDGRPDHRLRHADVQSSPSGSKMKGGATAEKVNQKLASRSQAESRRNRDTAAEPTVTDLGPSAPGGDVNGKSIVFQRSPADRPQSLTRRDEEMVSSTQSTRIRQWNREMTLAPTKAAVPRQPHRRSLPVITTEMYQSSESRSGDSTEKATRSPRNKTLLLLHERKSRSFDSTFDERHQGQGYASHGEYYQIDVESQEEFCRTYQDKLKHISRGDTQDMGTEDNYPARHDSQQRSPRRADYDAYHTETLEQSHEASPRRTKELSPRRDKGLSPRREDRDLRQKSPQKSPREELREYFERGRSQRQEPPAYPSPHEKRKDISPKSNRDLSPYESSDHNRQRSPRRQQEEGFDSLDCVDSRGYSDRSQGERGASRRHLPSPRRSDAQQVSPKHTADQSELYHRQDTHSENRSRYDRGDPYQPSNPSVDYKPEYPRHRPLDNDSGYSTSAQRPVDPFRDKRHRLPELGQSESIESRSQDGKAQDKRGSMQSTSKRHLLKLMHKKKSQSFDGPYEYMSGEKDSRSDSASESDRTKMRRKQCFQQQKSYSVDSPYDLPNAEGSELIKSTTRTGEIVTQLTITEPITLSGFSANSTGSVEPEPEKPSNEPQANTQYSYLNVPGAVDPSDKKQNKFVHQKSHSVDVAEGNNMPADDGKRLLETKPLQQSYPSDSKSNDLSNIRKKSIGDLMNELQKLKDERKKALKQAVADFHDMASRQTTTGPEQEPSPNNNNKEAVNARRNRFHQQKSYSLDTPQAVRYKSIADIPYHPPVREPAPKQETEPPGGSVSNSRSSGSGNNKSNQSVKAKRMSQFQQQKSYSLDMIEEHSSRQHPGSGTEPGQPQHHRRRVASESSDRPLPSEPGSYGSNRQKLMQLRAMKLLPDQDHDDQPPSTPPNLKTSSRPTRLYAPNSQQDYVSSKPVAPRDYGSYPRDRDPQRDYSPRRGSGYDGEGVFENEVGTYLEAKDRDRDRDRDKGRHLSPNRHREHSLSPHRDSEGYGGGRACQLSPSGRDGSSKHTSPARHGRDVSHSSPGRPRGTSPGVYDRRDFISPGWEGECPLETNPSQPVEGSPRQQYMSLSRSDLLQAIKDRLELSPFLEKAKQDFNAVPQSPPQRTPRKKLNARMKSFSLDTPDPPRPMAVIDESSKKKSSSLVASSACFGATSPGQGQGQLRPRFWGRSSSFDVDDSCESQSPHSVASLSPRSGNSRNNSGPSSPKTQRRSISANAFAVLYNFKGKEKGDLDLRAGWRVNAIDTTDADWWKGKSNGRIGYFPSNYVTRLHPGEHILQVSHAFEVSAQEHGQAVRLLKDQIVIREGEDIGGMVMIRTASDVHFPCPVKYLSEVGS